MKAIIMEIKRDHCIVATEDGRFLRRNIAAGTYEIGDELIIEEALEETYQYGRPKRSRIMGVFTAVAVIAVLVIGTVFLVRYFRQYNAPVAASMVAQEDMVEKAIEEEVFAAEAAPAEGREEPAMAEAVDEASLNTMFERTYPIIEGTGSEEYIRELVFGFNITENRELQVMLENIGTAYVFNGKIDLIILYGDGSRVRMITMEISNFNPGETREELFPLESGEAEFPIVVSESR